MSFTQPVAKVRTASLAPGGDGRTMSALAISATRAKRLSPAMTSVWLPLSICTPLNRSG